MSLNPKIPITRGADNSIIGSARGVRVNFANSNVWTGSNSFQNVVYLNSTTYLQSTTYNYSSFYNQGTIYSDGNIFGTRIELTDYLKVAATTATHYEYPYAASFTLTYFPVMPGSIGGYSSPGGALSDDGYGNIYGSYYGIVATIDYSTGVVTDSTYGACVTYYITYTEGGGGYCELQENGNAKLLGDCQFGTIYDQSAAQSINPNARALYNFSSSPMLDWSGSALYAPSGFQTPAIVNDAGLAAGVYTPNITGINNVSSTTPRQATYMRVGNTVTVAGQVEITATSNNAQTTIGIELPIASTFTTPYECAGTAHTTSNTSAGHGASIQADASNYWAEMDYYETHSSTDIFTYHFTYQVV